MIIALFAGIASWSLLEYVLHRFAGHHRVLLGRRLNAFGPEHTRHHAQGDYFAPNWKKALSAAVVFGVLVPLVAAVSSWGHGVAYATGLAGFYLTYEWLHRRLHTHGPRNAYGRWARRHHFFHHFHDPRVNHGVTSPLWDIVFGTRAKVERVRVPRRLAMRWLCAQDEVKPEYRQDFELRGRAKAAHG